MTFTSDKVDELAMLYLSQQDISKLSPTELSQKFYDAKSEIEAFSKTIPNHVASAARGFIGS